MNLKQMCEQYGLPYDGRKSALDNYKTAVSALQRKHAMQLSDTKKRFASEANALQTAFRQKAVVADVEQIDKPKLTRKNKENGSEEREGEKS